jgi:hypothetical protein
MKSFPRTFSMLLSLGVLVAGMALVTTTPALTPEAEAATRQSGRTVVLPQIVQPGGSPASAMGARIAGEVKFSPARKGRKVIIQKRLGTGVWRKHAVGRQNRVGVVKFAGPAKKGARFYAYRGVAVKYGALGKVASRPQSTKVWKQRFLDQFGGTDLGAQWQDRVTNAASRKCSDVGHPAMSNVANGTLRLSVKRVGDCVVEGKNVGRYRNGQVSTQHMPDAGAFTRGVFAARIKFQQKRGQHGSFWMQPVSPQYLEGQPQASGAEIDVVEFFGQGYPQGGLASFLYNYGIDGGSTEIGGLAPNATQMLPGTDNWWKNYHVFSLEWTRKMYIFRVDGREHFRTKRGVSGIDEYMILSLLSSDWELLQAKKLGIKPGGTMHTDWVRVWQK